MIDIILKNGYVVTMDKKMPAIKNGGIAIDKGKIVYVGESEDVLANYTSREVIDCKNHVIMPGFVDAHGHAGHMFFKAVVGSTKHWMPAMTHMYKHYINDDFWYVEGRLSALDRLKNGITTGVCVMGSQPRCDDPIHAINNAKAYAEIGVRDIVCTGPCHTPWPHNFSRWVDGKRIMKAVSFEDCVKSLETVIKTLNNTNKGKTFAYVGPFGLVTSVNPSGATALRHQQTLTDHDKRQSKEMLRIAKEYNTRIHTDAFGGMIELAAQDKENALLGPDVHVQHCSYLSDCEIDILADTGTNASVSPGSKAPVHKMLDAGINVAATTDGSMHPVGFDMFECMRRFQQQYRLLSNDPDLLPSEKLLEMTTINAAKAVGLDDEIGSLEVGKKADIITINLNSPRFVPLFNVVHSIVCFADGSDVDNVIIDGKLKISGNIALGIDENVIFEAANKEAEVIVNRAGLSKFAYQDEIFWGKNRTYFEERYDLEWQRRDGGHYPIEF